jgi:hypothetical protein
MGTELPALRERLGDFPAPLGTFGATWRCRCSSRARNTTAIPPAPICSSSTYPATRPPTARPPSASELGASTEIRQNRRYAAAPG